MFSHKRRWRWFTVLFLLVVTAGLPVLLLVLFVVGVVYHRIRHTSNLPSIPELLDRFERAFEPPILLLACFCVAVSLFVTHEADYLIHAGFPLAFVTVHNMAVPTDTQGLARLAPNWNININVFINVFLYYLSIVVVRQLATNGKVSK